MRLAARTKKRRPTEEQWEKLVKLFEAKEADNQLVKGEKGGDGTKLTFGRDSPLSRSPRLGILRDQPRLRISTCKPFLRSLSVLWIKNGREAGQLETKGRNEKQRENERTRRPN